MSLTIPSHIHVCVSCTTNKMMTTKLKMELPETVNCGFNATSHTHTHIHTHTHTRTYTHTYTHTHTHRHTYTHTYIHTHTHTHTHTKKTQGKKDKTSKYITKIMRPKNFF